MHTPQPVGCHALKTQWTRTIKSCEWRNKGEKTTIHSTSVRGLMVLFHFKINLNDLLSASHIHDSVAGRILCCCWHRYAWKSPSYPWLCIPFGKGCRESMHNCTWWWGCGNEAFIHPDCHAQLKGRTCTNMIQQLPFAQEDERKSKSKSKSKCDWSVSIHKTVFTFSGS